MTTSTLTLNRAQLRRLRFEREALSAQISQEGGASPARCNRLLEIDRDIAWCKREIEADGGTEFELEIPARSAEVRQ